MYEIIYVEDGGYWKSRKLNSGDKPYDQKFVYETEMAAMEAADDLNDLYV